MLERKGERNLTGQNRTARVAFRFSFLVSGSSTSCSLYRLATHVFPQMSIFSCKLRLWAAHYDSCIVHFPNSQRLRNLLSVEDMNNSGTNFCVRGWLILLFFDLPEIYFNLMHFFSNSKMLQPTDRILSLQRVCCTWLVALFSVFLSFVEASLHLEVWHQLLGAKSLTTLVPNGCPHSEFTANVLCRISPLPPFPDGPYSSRFCQDIL